MKPKEKNVFAHVKNEGDLLLWMLFILRAVEIGLEIEHLGSFRTENAPFVFSWTWPKSGPPKRRFAHAY